MPSFATIFSLRHIRNIFENLQKQTSEANLNENVPNQEQSIIINNNNLSLNLNNNEPTTSTTSSDPETFVYIVLGVLILGFLFFVGNTIRCYLNRPRYIDDEDEYLDNEMVTEEIYSEHTTTGTGTGTGKGTGTSMEMSSDEGQKYKNKNGLVHY